MMRGRGGSGENVRLSILLKLRSILSSFFLQIVLENTYLPLSMRQTDKSLPVSWHNCLMRMAAANPAGPPPTISTSKGILSRGSLSVLNVRVTDGDVVRGLRLLRREEVAVKDLPSPCRQHPGRCEVVRRAIDRRCVVMN